MENQNYSHELTIEHFHFGHVGAVLSVAILLLGISWLKQPLLFKNVFSKPTSQSAQGKNLPKYYAYVEPVETNSPMVAGAQTINGPAILNEDGTFSPALSAGEILGVSTSDAELDAGKILVKEIPDSEQAIQKYILDVQNLEFRVIDNAAFETALSSQDEEKIKTQAGKFLELKTKLLEQPVPQSFAKLHKYKIAQYAAAIELLNNFKQADSNPELVSRSLGLFLNAQQQQETEAANLSAKFNSNQNE